MLYLHRALLVFWTYFFLCIRLHMSPSNWSLPIHSTRNQLKNILAKSFNSIWHRLILLNSRHISSFLKILLTRTVSLVAFLNFPCLVLTFSSVSFLNYFNPGIVFCSTTTRGWARSMRPSRPFAWDLWKRNIFCHARISYIYLKLFSHLSTIENWLTWTRVARPGTLILDKWRTTAIYVGINFATPVFFIVAFSF